MVASPGEARIMTADDPADAIRRSFVTRAITKAGARFEQTNGEVRAVSFGGDPPTEAGWACHLGLVDLCLSPRSGFKGRDAVAWLLELRLAIGADANRAYRQPDGSLAVKLAATEVLLLSGANGEWSTRPEEAWRDDGGLCFPVPRQESSLWFRVTGSCAAEMFAKLCGVDLRPARFPDLAVAQTSLARMNAIIVRDDIGDVPAYHVLADSASASYLWKCLSDAMAEYGGQPVGLDGYRHLVQETAV